jgi:hypothetical protein
MSDLPRHIEFDLAALADGSLAPERRESVLEQVRRAPELQAALDEQRHAVRLIGAVEMRAPAALRAQVQAMIAPRCRGRVFAAPRLGMAAAVAAALAVAAVAVGLSGGGASSLGVQQAVALTLSPATMGAPAESRTRRSQLAVSVGGVAFPYWKERFGWRSSGARSDRIDGRSVMTVFYADARGRRIGYAIVSGPAWATYGGTLKWRAGVPYWLLTHDGAAVVVWPRGGHLCVVSGRGVNARTLLRLAGWSGGRSSAA